MMSALAALAVVVIITGFTGLMLAALIIGIKTADRRHLRSAPRSICEAFARRVLLTAPCQEPASVDSGIEAVK